MTMLERVRASIPALPPAEQRVAKLVLSDPRGFASTPLGVVAVLQHRADRVVDHLDDQLARAVVLVHRAVHEGHALVDGAGQLQLEVGQAVVAHAAAEAHDGRLGHVRALGQLAHRRRRETARIAQHELGHALLGGR